MAKRGRKPGTKNRPDSPNSVLKNRKVLKISDICRMLQITPRTVRYYEQIGLLPYVKRSVGDMRVFDEADLELIKKIRRIQCEEGIALTERDCDSEQ